VVRYVGDGGVVPGVNKRCKKDAKRIAASISAWLETGSVRC
jgi:hypothetical protein